MENTEQVSRNGLSCNDITGLFNRETKMKKAERENEQQNEKKNY